MSGVRNSTPDEKARKWRRQLALIYWGLSPVLFPIIGRVFVVPGMLVASLFERPPAWLDWLTVPYVVCSFVCAAGFTWFLWTRIRELPPPIGS